MSAAGHLARIYISGTSTSFTGEAFTGSGAGPYTISDFDKNAWDYDTVPTFYDNAVAINAADILSIDYLFGKVTFTGSKTGPITADGDYFPLYSIANAHDTSMDFSRDIQEDTEFGDTAKSKCPTLVDLSVSFSLYGVLDVDLDTTGDERKLHDVLINGTEILYSFAPKGAETEVYRAWLQIESESVSATVDGLVEGTVDAVLAARFDSANRDASFGWIES